MKFPRRLALFNVFVIAFNISVSAAGFCGPRADFVKRLADKYNESSEGMGIAGEANIVEVFSSKKGTWTILVTTPTGISCIIAAGFGWQKLKQAIEGTSL